MEYFNPILGLILTGLIFSFVSVFPLFLVVCILRFWVGDLQ